MNKPPNTASTLSATEAAERQLPSIGDYYSATQLRADRWSALRAAVEGLSVTSLDSRKGKKLLQDADELMSALAPIETYWAFPGATAYEYMRRLLEQRKIDDFSHAVRRVVRALTSGAYRRRTIPLVAEDSDSEDFEDEVALSPEARALGRPYFEVLIVDSLGDQQERWLRTSLQHVRRPEDAFIYEAVVVPSLEDALIGILFNYNVQAVVVRPGLTLKSRNNLSLLSKYLRSASEEEDLDGLRPEEYGPETCRLIAKIRPELDTYLVTDRSAEAIAGLDLGSCRRVFYNQEDFLELHLNILRGVNSRYKSPFFTALKEYSKQPTGVFHAMPISRGKSITRSHWIQDMGAFYGPNIFLAETSATSGGLDSLLEPRGPIKKAQEAAARAFGSKQTFFATNGTSTCNKIVVQALVRPGDIVLVDRDCHKSHHYGMVLAGAKVVYMDSYPLNEHSMYGAVTLREIKHKLLELEAAGKLDKVRMVLLTNCTFDGLIYNVERVMEECLAIKKDLIFLWDEAWFAFARFNPVYRQRTAMHAAASLRRVLRSPERVQAYEEQQARLAEDEDGDIRLTTRLIAPPDARVRVYATQSTHKTLTSLRQGSMIHVYDQDFKGETEQAFHEAYMTHTSTSPNYQIIASLDVGRRQVELEGYEFVQRQIDSAMSLRRAIGSHPLLQKYFRVLTVADMIPPEYRDSGLESYYDAQHGWTDAWNSWATDEFVLDPTKITLAVGGTGWDGDTFKTQILMDKHGIQINKTSRNSVLFMTNIGTTRSSIAYLIEVLVGIAKDLDDLLDDASKMERRSFENRVKSLVEHVPPLPDFSRFHSAFRKSDTPEGDIRTAFFLAYDEDNCDYLDLNGELLQKLESGEELVSASFIIPYPPGFPILVPGQVISREILTFMRALDVSEIHGYRPDLGLRVFTTEALNSVAQT
ncbi:MAG: aminotransferase class I/II-fold pyridoxal phosphate-dependent enzyme [Rhodobacteraceae bacterium]|nr:aminotransferase class I/II-fold pyridoxal phosphate-dependent enzyme [Paracoccaceae bacterium]